MFTQRTKYYSGWKLTQASTVFCGLSYSGLDKETNKEKFDKVETCKIFIVEFDPNPKVKIQVKLL